MKISFRPLAILLLVGALLFSCQNTSNQAEPNSSAEITEADNEAVDIYDAEKAAEYGADAYGMKKYVMAFLKRGPNRDLDSAKSAALQLAHLENIGKMAEAGKLIVAGPFFGDGDLRGIYIFDVPSIAEAEALTNSDPAIQEGSLEMELLEWYGSAALMGLNEIHKTLEKKNVTETVE